MAHTVWNDARYRRDARPNQDADRRNDLLLRLVEVYTASKGKIKDVNEL